MSRGSARRTYLNSVLGENSATIATRAAAVPYGIDLGSYPSLSDKNILITGSGRGIGYNTARMLGRLGATVIITDMQQRAIDEAVSQLQQEYPKGNFIAAKPLDLSSQDKVHTFAQWMQAQDEPLHVLLNNAGANFMGVQPWFTGQGVAGIPQVNLLGPFTLTRLLQQQLLAAKAPRVVNVCSIMHRYATLPEPNFVLRDWEAGTYRNCKLALTMMTGLLQQKLGPAGLVAASVDPGAVYSNIWATSRILGRPPASLVLKALFSTPADACATSLHAVATPDLVPGGYYARGLFASGPVLNGIPEPLAGLMSVVDWPLRSWSNGGLGADVRCVPVAPAAADMATGQRLWDACSELAGLSKEVELPAAAAQTAAVAEAAAVEVGISVRA